MGAVGMARMTGHNRTTPGQVRTCPPGASGPAYPDGTGHTPLGVSGLVRSGLSHPHRTLATGDALTALRDRLICLRADIAAQLTAADVLDAGRLVLLGNVGAALDAVPTDAVPAARVVLVDDGETIQLVAYAEAIPVAAVPLSPQRAIALARGLIAAAH